MLIKPITSVFQKSLICGRKNVTFGSLTRREKARNRTRVTKNPFTHPITQIMHISTNNHNFPVNTNVLFHNQLQFFNRQMTIFSVFPFFFVFTLWISHSLCGTYSRGAWPKYILSGGFSTLTSTRVAVVAVAAWSVGACCCSPSRLCISRRMMS